MLPFPNLILEFVLSRPQAPGPWGTTWGPWEEGDGQDWSRATGWHIHTALHGFERELNVRFSGCSNLYKHSVGVCLRAHCVHRPVSDSWAGYHSVIQRSTFNNAGVNIALEKQCRIFTLNKYATRVCTEIRLRPDPDPPLYSLITQRA